MKILQLTERPPGSSFNIYRKAWHTLGLVVPIIFYMDYLHWPAQALGISSRALAVIVMTFLSFSLLAVDLIRFRFEAVNRLFFSLVGFMLKKQETQHMNATVPYFFASVILFLFFSPQIAMLACIFLMIGDPVAAFLGGYLGRLRFWNGKSLEGFGGFIMAGFLGSILFLWLNTLKNPFTPYFVLTGASGLDVISILIVLGGCLLGAVAEFFSGTSLAGLLDDNLIVPVTGALSLALFATVAGYPPQAVFFNPLQFFQ